MSVRAKFQVIRIEAAKDNDKVRYSIHMLPVFSGSDENKKFFAATPGGEISLYTINEAAGAQFKQDGYYYVDFTEAEA